VALEGNLKDFSVADMFRLLASGDKSGVLHVAGTRGEGLVCFRGGEVFFASSGDAGEAIGGRLVSSGVISGKQLRQATGLMKIQKKDKADRKLGQILVDEGYLEAGVLERVLREQIADALFELLRWDDGELRFESDATCAEADLGVSVPVDTVLADADRRLELWHLIKEKIPTGDTRFAMASEPGDKPADIHLKPSEWMLLCFLHNGRTVDELVEQTGYNDFETTKTLFGMYAEGLIVKVGPAGETLAE
jgi:hypothetical protein